MFSSLFVQTKTIPCHKNLTFLIKTARKKAIRVLAYTKPCMKVGGQWWICGESQNSPATAHSQQSTGLDGTKD